MLCLASSSDEGFPLRRHVLTSFKGEMHMKKRKIEGSLKILIISVLVLFTFLLYLIASGCSAHETTVINRPGTGNHDAIKDATPQEQQECSVDSDCVPLPSCHPHACINKKFESNYKRPEICTELFDCSAAYSAEDCICSNNRCVDKNLGNKGCADANINKQASE